MSKTFFVEIVALGGHVFKGDVVSLQAPGVGGSFQILRNHAPMLSALEVGLIDVKDEHGEEIVFATSGGFVQVVNNHVIVLAETAEAAGEINIDRVRAAEEKALQRLKETTDEGARLEAQRELEIARNRLRVAMGKVGA